MLQMWSILRRWVTEDLRPATRPARLPQPRTAFAIAALERAFQKVKANDGGPGGDGVTIGHFDIHRAGRLEALSHALASGAYRPGKARHLTIPKPGGGARPLCIPTVTDRIAQTAWLAATQAGLDARMHGSSFAYRPGRGVREALVAARGAVRSGRVWVVRIDIERCFESAPHDILMRDLPGWIADRRYLRLVEQWLSALAPAGMGLPQGSPVSPILANIHLDPVDRALAKAGVVSVRYADDIALFTRSPSEAEAALRLAGAALAGRGLRLNGAKTAILHAADGAAFLGELLVVSRYRRLVRRLVRLFTGDRGRLAMREGGV